MADPETALSLPNARFAQMFPVLDGPDIDRMRRFGTVRHFADRTFLVETGKVGPGLIVVLSGHVAISQRDGLGHVNPVVDHGPGHFVGEVGQLSGTASLVDARAEGEVEALILAPDRLRALMVAEAGLGERIMRALILRRVALVQSGVGGPILVGAPDTPDIMRLQGFLTRNAHPYHLLDPANDAEAAALVAACPLGLADLPWVMLSDGTVLHNPSEQELARKIGMAGTRTNAGAYDVAIVGAGPAGLATAVYAASEGLSVAVLDSRAYGGQAGASARIENYFGFPTGISGAALAGRAFVQAQKFGAEIMIPVEVRSLDCDRADGFFALELDGGERISARAVVIASGARYRRPAIPDLKQFEGKGIWYWASPIEGTHAAGQEVIVVGGGNSAGQAAVYLSGVAATVHVVIRGAGLAASMSRYLIDRIAAAPNIVLHTHTELSQLAGSSHGLERVAMRDSTTGAEAWHAIRNVFLFVGADPATDWLSGCGVEVDRPGFVATGSAAERGRNPLETSVPGVFAVGDVRSGSVKRVGAAIGEGAQVVAAIHAYLAETNATAA